MLSSCWLWRTIIFSGYTTFIFDLISGNTYSSSAPSVTSTASETSYFERTASSSSVILRSEVMPISESPVRVTISAGPLRLIRSNTCTALKIALTSESVGSLRASLFAAKRFFSLPITGPTIPAFTPKSSSLSIQITRVAFFFLAIIDII